MRDQLLFAPFWVDVDIRREGNIWYGFHKTNNVTDIADDLVHQLSPAHSDFKTQAAFIATWENVPNFPDGSPSFHDEKSSLRNMFQAAIITDFSDTFLMYCYSDIEFSGRQQSAEVGYSAGDGSEFVNHRGSLTEDVLQVSQFKTGNFTGLLFFHLTDTGLAQNNAAMQCRNWYCNDRDRFGDQPQWTDSLDPCPWTLSHAEIDFRYLPVLRSRRRGRCFIQDFPLSVSIGGELLTPETECCYRFQDGALNLGPPFGGSASPYHRFSSNFMDRELHDQLTVQPFNWCCLESHNCHLYFERRPSSSSSSYLPPQLG